MKHWYVFGTDFSSYHKSRFLIYIQNQQNETEPEARSSDELIWPEEATASPKQSLENAFTIKDLSSLLKNLEAEIALNEQHLRDENEKREMFKVTLIRPKIYNNTHFQVGSIIFWRFSFSPLG